MNKQNNINQTQFIQTMGRSKNKIKNKRKRNLKRELAKKGTIDTF